MEKGSAASIRMVKPQFDNFIKPPVPNKTFWQHGFFYTVKNKINGYGSGNFFQHLFNLHTKFTRNLPEVKNLFNTNES